MKHFLAMIVAALAFTPLTASAHSDFLYAPDNDGRRVLAAKERVAHTRQPTYQIKGHRKAEAVHYNGPKHKNLGYWRHGPATGYGFGFASYKGDPFGSDDYYDRAGCYYLHHKNFCLDFTPPRGFPH
jgi:hypothetical protein